MSQTDEFYHRQEEPNKSCLLALRKIILSHDGITETKKYGMPCFCYHAKMMCYLWTDKKTNEPYILFVDGNKMDHPALETGSRARMKILRINPSEDLPVETIQALLTQAIGLIG